MPRQHLRTTLLFTALLAVVLATPLGPTVAAQREQLKEDFLLFLQEEGLDQLGEVFVEVVGVEANEPVANDNEENAAEDDGEENPQLAALEQQLRPQYETLLHGQLHAINRLCSLTPAQQAALLADGEQAMSKTLRKSAKRQLRQNGHLQGLFVGGQVLSNPRDEIFDALTKSAEEHLDEDQKAKLSVEFGKRVAFRKRATVGVLVKTIDQRLLLSEEQREKLTANLIEHWNSAWADSAAMLMHGPDYLPQIPSKLVTPLLDAKQKAIWKSMPRNGQIWFNAGMAGNLNLKVDPFRPEPAVADSETAEAVEEPTARPAAPQRAPDAEGEGEPRAALEEVLAEPSEGEE